MLAGWPTLAEQATAKMAESKINNAVNKMVDDLDRSLLRDLQVR